MELAMQLFVWNWRMFLFHLSAPIRLVRALLMVLEGQRPTEEEATKAGHIIGLGVRCVIGRLIEAKVLLWAPYVKEHWVFSDENKARQAVWEYFADELDLADRDILDRVSLELGASAIRQQMESNWRSCLEATHQHLLGLDAQKA